MTWTIGLAFAPAAVLAGWLSVRSPSWISPQPAAWEKFQGKLGALFGVCCGLWGGVVGGILAPNQIAHTAALAWGGLLLGGTVGALVGGLADLRAGRPRHVSRPYLLLGILGCALLGFLMPVAYGLYQ